MKLAVKDIIELPEAQCRHALSKDTIDRYADLLQSGVELPPAKVVYEKRTGKYLLYDGTHTLYAHRKIGREEMEVEVEEGTAEDAAWWAISQNKTHGLTRSVADREKAILNALQHPNSKGWTEEELAQYIGTSRREIFRVRQKFEQSKNPGRTRDHEYEGAIKIIRDDSPTLADNISVGIVDMPKQEVIRLAAKEDGERKALVPVMAERRLTLKQAEQLVQYIPKDEGLPLKVFIDFVERHPEDRTFYFRDHNVQVDITIND